MTVRDAVFASDVHLSDAHPATTAAFLAFVDREVAGRARRLYLLGDLFDYWAGDEDGESPLARELAARLRSLQDGGVEVFFMAGNRDFLVGPAYAAAAGMTVVDDPHAVTIGGVELLLAHGDALCVDDVPYQRFRSMVREPAWQRAFLAKPIAERRAIAAGVRTQSESAKKEKAADIMDVNANATCALLAAHPGAVLVHGHTHRPAVHAQDVDGGARERRVLTDWDADAMPPRGGGLALEGGVLRILSI